MSNPNSAHVSAALFSIVLLCYATTITAQDSTRETQAEKQKTIGERILSKNFVFTAQTARPTKGRTRPLNSGYRLIVTNDRIDVYLPYFGRTYDDGTEDNSNEGIDFGTPQFDYVSSENSKHVFTITIRIHGVDVAQKILLNVSPSGSATVQIISNYREMISFYGQIQ